MEEDMRRQRAITLLRAALADVQRLTLEELDEQVPYVEPNAVNVSWLWELADGQVLITFPEGE